MRELEAINQYMTHHHELENKDFGKLASKIKEIAIGEMKHAERLAERILFLKGEPISETDASSKKGQQMPEMLATDMALERRAVKMYNEAAVICASEKDQKSKDLFEELLITRRAEFHGLCPWVNVKAAIYGMFRVWKPEYLGMEFTKQSITLCGSRNIAVVS